MIYLQLFFAFLKIGCIAFGGGYSAIPLVEETVTKYGWLTSEEILNYIAVCESTPGPISINMATFVGASQGGILGAMLATFAITLPAYLLILLISMYARNLIEKKPAQALIGGIKPAVMGLIIATSITLCLSVVFNIDAIGSTFSLDIFALLILAVVIITSVVYKKLKKQPISPIILIIISGILGIICYGV
jgi:chromate transporter